MIIRLADLETDALAILDGARDFISRTDYAEFMPAGDDDLAAGLGRVFSTEGVEVVVAEEAGTILGGIGMLYTPFLWNARLKMADEIFMWTKRDASPTTLLRLLRFVGQRMKHHGVDVCMFYSMTTSPDGVEKLYRFLGLEKIHTMWGGTIRWR